LDFFFGQPNKVLFMFEDEKLPTGWSSDFTLTKEKGEVLAFFQKEREEYEEAEKRLQAERQLKKKGREMTGQDFLSAVIDGDAMAVSLFIQVGFSANTEDKAGISVLHWAVRKNHLDIVSFLLEAGADVNLRSKDRGHTPLMDASLYGSQAMLELLLNYKPELNVASGDGQTALILLMGRDKEDLCLTLLKAGADPEIADKLGMSARGYAGLFGKKKVLEYLESV
jgi:ankyrin repeat protein